MQSVRADVLEALIASIYLDGGLEAASAFIHRFWSDRLHIEHAARRDSKTELQEWGPAPAWNLRIHERSAPGPDHDPVFTVSVSAQGKQAATGNGRSKRAAEQDAARVMLVREGVWQEEKDEA
ncbi:MAG: putative dsRNA-binding protein [Nitratireductor sp.]